MNDTHPEKLDFDPDELDENEDTGKGESQEGFAQKERQEVVHGSQKKRGELDQELSEQRLPTEPVLNNQNVKEEHAFKKKPKEKEGFFKKLFGWVTDGWENLKTKFKSWLPKFLTGGERFEKLKHYEQTELLNPAAPAFTFLKGSTVRLSSDYGMRVHPVDKTEKMHNGIDLAAKDGTPIIATQKGRVDGVGVSGRGGNWIAIVFENGDRLSFSHLLKFPVAKQGQTIEVGDLIGLVGSTGKSTGNHVHVELKVHGKHQDPEKYKTV